MVTIWRLIGDYAGPLGDYVDTSWDLGTIRTNRNYLEAIWGRFKDYLGTTWGQLGDYVTTWGQLGDNLGTT